MLTNTKKYTVGRSQQCDLSLVDDNSVSREHAVIHRSSSGIRVEDLGSKYGTYVNTGIDTNKFIEKNKHIDLKAGNIVRFGKLENVYRLENIEYNVCTSTMALTDVTNLKKQLKNIDGEIQNAWSTECTHLVMTSVTVTVKVLQSLAYGIPIISPAYFDAVIASAQENHQELPNVNDFVPRIVEPYIIKEPGMMEVHLDRQRLFQNKTFVFMVKRQMERFEPIIKLAAGKCYNMEEGNLRKSALLKSDHIPVSYTPAANSQCSTSVASIIEYVESHNRRLISETEIGLAIIHRATDRFCNPDRKMLTDFEPAGPDTKEIMKGVLHDETPQGSSSEKPVESSVHIPESITLSTEPNNNICNDKIIDLDQPSTSGTRRTTRSSMQTTLGETKSTTTSETTPKVPTPKKSAKTATPKKNSKRKAELENSESDANQEQNVPEKKQKTANESQGESSSAHFIAPMPPSSDNILNFSGFISTQSRKRKNPAEPTSQTSQRSRLAETTAATRKRALDMLNADSDEDIDDKEEGVFSFKTKSKRPKVASYESGRSARNTMNEDDNSDDDDGFNFSKKTSQVRQKQSKISTQKNTNDEVDGGASFGESQNSYKKPFQQTLNRSFLRFAGPPIDITSPIKCHDDTDWITCKIKKELNLNEQPQSSPVMIKEEKMEEWAMNTEEKKREWIKSFANVFQVRTIEVNKSRRVAADETDSFFSNSGNTTVNKGKNFKKFVKVILFYFLY